ncbi:hypothetical protein HZH68_013278 [Vespula germanica]|uniref:Uncharacterized protein n=3 Tax=Vespula TaxID=7451 RepID=A0A834JIL3_VESGE|nr:hypothetical protein HZH66_012032 [Vespula vulgaris]KAF7386146.1 hypothetical protein HZH68_013278 [Vespula germanica]
MQRNDLGVYTMVKELGGATAVPSFEWVVPLRKAPRGRVKQRSNVAEAQMTVRIPTVPWIDGPRQDLWFSSLSHSRFSTHRTN